jgi:hypothetical protein
LDVLKRLIPRIKNNLFEKMVQLHLKTSQLPLCLMEISDELKPLIVAIVVVCMTSQIPLYKYFSRIISQGPKDLNFPVLKDANSIHTRVYRLLLACACFESTIQRPQTNVDMNAVLAHQQYINNDILVSKCPNPNCRIPFDFWSGCFSVRCDKCASVFCGWCFALCGRDAHPHVLVCPYNPNRNNYFGSEAQYKAVR